MSRRQVGRWLGLVLAASVASSASAADVASRMQDAGSLNTAAIERLIDDWYVEHCAAEEGRPYRLMAPGGIDASPAYRHQDNGSAALGPRYFVSLAATMPLFRYEVTGIVSDARFAKVRVRERGYRYAGAAKVTYERMGNTLMVLERQDDGRWLVLAHQTYTTGFHSSLGTTPLPDLGPDADGHARPAPEPRCGRYRADEFAGG